ncbi:hypothetical protein A5825_003361 [Enterococcus gallinarum]|nr:hypothetical protein A5825_003361 [Enterococcus gallinarum]
MTDIVKVKQDNLPNIIFEKVGTV